MIRRLNSADIADYLRLLAQLSPVDVSVETDFVDDFFKQVQVWGIFSETDQLLAIGSIYILPKMSRGGVYLGAIEDIVVDHAYQGQGLGKQMVRFLCQQARNAGCYKCLLSCQESKIPFYSKCDFLPKETTMMMYFEHP